jgi:hypothetical protein
MNRQHKIEIREFLYERLFDESLRQDLGKMCRLACIDEFEGMNVYEQETARIRKLLCLDAQ